MPESLVEIWGMILIVQNKGFDPALCKGSDPDLAREIHIIFRFPSNISVALITYLELNHDTFWVT